MHRTRTSRSTALAALAAVALLAAGCSDDSGDAEAEETETVYVDQDGNPVDPPEVDEGDDPGDDDDEAGPPLTQEQLEVVVLTQENVGQGWTGGAVPTEDDGTAPGCFGEVTAISDSLDQHEVAEYDVEYSYGDSGLPSVASGAVSFAEEAPVAEAFEQLKAALEPCTSVTGTDSDGLTWDVTVTYDDIALGDATDDQINYSARGTISDEDGNSFDVILYSSLVRIGRNVIDISTSDVEDRADLHAEYVKIGVDRFVDVVIDSEPDETTAPAPA